MKGTTGWMDFIATLIGVSFRDEWLLCQLGSSSHRELLVTSLPGTSLCGEAVFSDNTGPASPRGRLIKEAGQLGSINEKIVWSKMLADPFGRDTTTGKF